MLDKVTEQIYSRSKSRRCLLTESIQGHQIYFLVLVQCILLYLEKILQFNCQMFDFDLAEEGERPKVNRNQKKRNDYSAGFINQGKGKRTCNIPSQEKRSNQNDFIANLKIGNLQQLYEQQTKQKIDNTKTIKQQQQSVNRLFSTNLNKSKVSEPQNNQEDNQSNVKFSDVYHIDKNFIHKATNKIVGAEFKKIKDKLVELFGKSQLKKRFEDYFAQFFAANIKKFIKKTHISNDELILSFQNHLNMIRHEKCQEQLQYEIEDLRKIVDKNVFFWFFFDKQKLNLFEDDLSENEIKILIRQNFDQIQNIQLDPKVIKNNFKSFTIPYESHLHAAIGKSGTDLNHSPKEEQKEQKFVFNANPIPKTTYEKPKQRPKTSKAKTQTQPFNFQNRTSQKKQSIDDYYNWDKQFKANQIPKTTYQAQQIQKLTEEEKRKRMFYLLKTSKAPSSMNYLSHYKNFAEEKKVDLSNKYVKTFDLKIGHSIPNFQKLHKQQMKQLEDRKNENKKMTKPQPFNLHETKVRQSKTENLIGIHTIADTSQIEKKQKSNKVQYIPKSTLKYEAYVNQLKKQKQQKQIKKQQQNNQKNKRQKSMNNCKNILKERVDQEVNKVPKPQIFSNRIGNSTLKVDLQKIYLNEPLLMERESQKSLTKVQNFSNTYQPII